MEMWTSELYGFLLRGGVVNHIAGSTMTWLDNLLSFGFSIGHHFVGLDRLCRVASDDGNNRKVVLYLLILEVAASIYIFRVENTASPKTATHVSVGTSNVWLSNELDMSAASKKQYMTLERSSIH
jgi:hypothetical protein